MDDAWENDSFTSAICIKCIKQDEKRVCCSCCAKTDLCHECIGIDMTIVQLGSVNWSCPECSQLAFCNYFKTLCRN